MFWLLFSFPLQRMKTLEYRNPHLFETSLEEASPKERFQGKPTHSLPKTPVLCCPIVIMGLFKFKKSRRADRNLIIGLCSAGGYLIQIRVHCFPKLHKQFLNNTIDCRKV